MPAVRRSHHDIIIRVPRAVNVPKTEREEEGKNEESSSSQQQQQHSRTVEGAELLNSAPHTITDGSALTPSRRSASPVKQSKSDENQRSTMTEGDASGSNSQKTDNKLPPSKYHYANQAISSAEWNSLLIWARRQRGPQWDSATGMWQVDQGSTEYYAFSNDPARHTKLSTATLHSNRHDQNEKDVIDGVRGNDVDDKQIVNITSNEVTGGTSSISNVIDMNASGANNNSSLPPFLQSSSSVSGSGTFQNAPIGSNDDSSPPPMGPGGRRARGR